LDGVVDRAADGDRARPAVQRDHGLPGRIEIMLANGVSIRIEGSVEAVMLKAAITSARR
jgi:hypothetical protein